MSRYNMCPHTPSTYSDIYLIMDQLAQYLLSKRLTPTRWFGLTVRMRTPTSLGQCGFWFGLQQLCGIFWVRTLFAVET